MISAVAVPENGTLTALASPTPLLSVFTSNSPNQNKTNLD